MQRIVLGTAAVNYFATPKDPPKPLEGPGPDPQRPTMAPRLPPPPTRPAAHPPTCICCCCPAASCRALSSSAASTPALERASSSSSATDWGMEVLWNTGEAGKGVPQAGNLSATGKWGK